MKDIMKIMRFQIKINHQKMKKMKKKLKIQKIDF